MSVESKKRHADFSQENARNKKHKKQWRVPRKGSREQDTKQYSIEAGNSGIWITCDMHKQPACVSEAKDLFTSHAEKMYAGSINAMEDPKPVNTDLEASIQSELSDMQEPRTPAIFRNIKIDTRCIVFIRTQKPIEPVSFVKQICQEASEDSDGKRTRYIKRMTPMTMMGKATGSGLETVAKHVLGPHFHNEGAPSRKFAIRPTIREHSDLKRDDVIKQIARLVGQKHSVDLKQYDLLILVEIYRNVLGMSVVGNDYEKLKRYNLAELYAPTSSAQEAALPDVVRPAAPKVDACST